VTLPAGMSCKYLCAEIDSGGKVREKKLVDVFSQLPFNHLTARCLLGCGQDDCIHRLRRNDQSIHYAVALDGCFHVIVAFIGELQHFAARVITKSDDSVERSAADRDAMCARKNIRREVLH